MTTKPIEYREADFIRTVNTYSIYPEDMRKAFLEYWTEKTPGGKKMRFEQEKTWDTGRRLGRWAANQKLPQAKVISMKPAELTDIERLDKLLSLYSKNPTSYGVSELLKWNMAALKKCYDTIKENRLWDPSITKQEVEKWMDDEWTLKANVIYRTLNYYGLNGWRFEDTLNARSKLVK